MDIARYVYRKLYYSSCGEEVCGICDSILRPWLREDWVWRLRRKIPQVNLWANVSSLPINGQRWFRFRNYIYILYCKESLLHPLISQYTIQSLLHTYIFLFRLRFLPVGVQFILLNIPMSQIFKCKPLKQGNISIRFSMCPRSNTKHIRSHANVDVDVRKKCCPIYWNRTSDIFLHL